MSQKEIKLFDDSIIKLTVKQGTEKERFPVTIEKDGKFTYNDDVGNITDYENIINISGSLNAGELGYTRDTNRLFVGNISDTELENSQHTLGGVLTGNKYLGFIDSRKKIVSSEGENDLIIAEENAKPLPLPELLGNDSEYRSYNFSSSSNNGPFYTNDKKWAKMSYYNPKYDAYDGDYVYDIYRNALILFDHNIKPENSTTSSGLASESLGNKIKTPLLPLFHEKTDINNNTTNPAHNVYSFTNDMYGDGYVLLYNIIPDGETLTFRKKGFNNENEYSSVNDTDEPRNYSYNIITLNKVPVKLINTKEHFDETYFDFGKGVITFNEDTTDKINNTISISAPPEDKNLNTNVLLSYSYDGENDKYFKSHIEGSILEDLQNFIKKDIPTSTAIETKIDNILENKGYVTSEGIQDIINGQPAEDYPSSSSSSGGFPDWRYSSVNELIPKEETSNGTIECYFKTITTEEGNEDVIEYSKEEYELDKSIKKGTKTVAIKNILVTSGSESGSESSSHYEIIKLDANTLTIQKNKFEQKTTSTYTSDDKTITNLVVEKSYEIEHPNNNYFIILTPNDITSTTDITVYDDLLNADGSSAVDSEPKTWNLSISGTILLPFSKSYKKVEITNVKNYQIIESL